MVAIKDARILIAEGEARTAVANFFSACVEPSLAKLDAVGHLLQSDVTFRKTRKTCFCVAQPLITSFRPPRLQSGRVQRSVLALADGDSCGFRRL